MKRQRIFIFAVLIAGFTLMFAAVSGASRTGLLTALAMGLAVGVSCALALTATARPSASCRRSRRPPAHR
ncbi:hypothetical protein [Dyella sp.]|jgi:hypothetical protein|uniref:hypothetical protein n=1 Tax=Dyella sp. TaxID=1869338 RepID=UPI002D7A2C2E|nr:hypothetical protein [Dyella sp.]HET6431700.1 hypothetical protein [Dyella sp.]